MPDDGDDQDQEVVGVQDLVQQTSDQAGLVHKLSQETVAASSAVRRQGTRARELLAEGRAEQAEQER